MYNSPKAIRSVQKDPPFVTEPDFARMRSAMIDSQLRPNTVTDDRVIAAFRAVPREDFVPADFRPFAYFDEDIEVAPGRFLMEPLTLGKLVERLGVRDGERALVVGGSTGYSAAILAELGADVTLLDEEGVPASDALSRWSVRRIDGALADGSEDSDAFDLMLIEGSIQRLPAALVAQMVEGGRIAAVVMDDGIPRAGIGRVYGGHVGWTYFAEAYVPTLPGFAVKKEFSF